MGNPLTLETEISQCRKCAEFLAQKLVDPTSGTECVQPRPIVPHFDRQSILLIGQAPGLAEYRTGRPFQGDAGQSIRKILAEVGIPLERFDEIVSSTAIVKCFPGSALIVRDAGIEMLGILLTLQNIDVFHGEVRLRKEAPARQPSPSY